MLQQTLPPGETPTVEQHVLWRQECAGDVPPSAEAP
jgi:hypothetical protein